MKLSFILLLSALSTGCAHYEYDLVRPPDLAQHIGSNEDAVVTVQPLRYRMRTVDDSLVVRIYNSTTQPVQLLGGQSTAVDPQGQSHPLHTQSIAPNSFIKLILPPPAPDVQPSGPTIGFGLGVGRGFYGGGAYDAWGDPYPRAYANPAASPYYWTWPGEGDARLELTFQTANQPIFTQSFLFHRRRK